MNKKEYEENVKQMIPFNLQFFAENEEEEQQEENQEGEEVNETDDNKTESEEKKFTQKELERIAAKEKNEGKKTILKQLGFKSTEEAKKAIALYQALINSQKNEEEKKGEEAENALRRAEEAENKLACVIAGVSKDAIEDALAIAKRKVTDEKNLESVLTEMKSEPKYKSFFDEDLKSEGTGSDPTHGVKDQKNKKGSYGATLAKTSTQQKSKKSSYF